MKATVTHIEDTATSNLIRVHHVRKDEDDKDVKGFVNHSRFSAHIPAVGDEIELDPKDEGGEEPAAETEVETEKEPAAAE